MQEIFMEVWSACRAFYAFSADARSWERLQEPFRGLKDEQPLVLAGLRDAWKKKDETEAATPNLTVRAALSRSAEPFVRLTPATTTMAKLMGSANSSFRAYGRKQGRLRR